MYVLYHIICSCANNLYTLYSTRGAKLGIQSKGIINKYHVCTLYMYVL